MGLVHCVIHEKWIVDVVGYGIRKFKKGKVIFFKLKLEALSGFDEVISG